MGIQVKKYVTPGAIIVLLLFILYVIMTFMTPQTATSQEQFKIGERALVWIRLSIALPYFIVWISAYYCLRVFKKISHNSGSIAIFSHWFARGFLLLLTGAITTTLLGALRSLMIFHSPNFVPALTILINYGHAVFPLVAFIAMYRGIKKSDSVDIYKKRRLIAPQTIMVALMIGFIYIPLVFTNPSRQIGFSADSPASYYLPDFLIITTLQLPIIIGWALGIGVAMKINEKFLAFKIERSTSFINGLFLVIFSSMILQAILSLGTGQLYRLGLGLTLILVYVLIFSQVAGYVLAARGVRAFERGAV